MNDDFLPDGVNPCRSSKPDAPDLCHSISGGYTARPDLRRRERHNFMQRAAALLKLTQRSVIPFCQEQGYAVRMGCLPIAFTLRQNQHRTRPKRMGIARHIMVDDATAIVAKDEKQYRMPRVSVGTEEIYYCNRLPMIRRNVSQRFAGSCGLGARRISTILALITSRYDDVYF